MNKLLFYISITFMQLVTCQEGDKPNSASPNQRIYKIGQIEQVPIYSQLPQALIDTNPQFPLQLACYFFTHCLPNGPVHNGTIILKLEDNHYKTAPGTKSIMMHAVCDSYKLRCVYTYKKSRSKRPSLKKQKIPS